MAPFYSLVFMLPGTAAFGQLPAAMKTDVLQSMPSHTLWLLKLPLTRLLRGWKKYALEALPQEAVVSTVL